MNCSIASISGAAATPAVTSWRSSTSALFSSSCACSSAIRAEGLATASAERVSIFTGNSVKNECQMSTPRTGGQMSNGGSAARLEHLLHRPLLAVMPQLAHGLLGGQPLQGMVSFHATAGSAKEARLEE